MKSPVWLVMVALAVVCNGIGCAHVNVAEHMLKQKPIAKSGLPWISVDADASMILGNVFIQSEYIIKEELIQAVESYWNASAANLSRTQDARVLIQITGDWSTKYNFDGWFLILPPLIGWTQLLGLPTDWAKVEARVRIQVGERELVGTATGKCYAGLYYPGDPASCAMSKAVVGAVRKAAASY